LASIRRDTLGTIPVCDDIRFSQGGFYALISPLVAELFGTKSHGTIFGMVLFISQIGGTIGPVATGRIFDLTRSYQLAFLIFLVASVLGSVLSILLRPIIVEGKSKPKK